MAGVQASRNVYNYVSSMIVMASSPAFGIIIKFYDTLIPSRNFSFHEIDRERFHLSTTTASQPIFVGVRLMPRLELIEAVERIDLMESLRLADID